MSEHHIEEMHLEGYRQIGHDKKKIKLELEVAPNGNFYGTMKTGLFNKYPIYGSIRSEHHSFKLIFGHASNDKGHHQLTEFYKLSSHKDHMKGYYHVSLPINHKIKPSKNDFMNEHEFKVLKHYCEQIKPEHNSGEVELHIVKLHNN